MFTSDLSDDDLARIAVADQMRRMHHLLVGRSHDPAAMESLARRLGEEADLLAENERREKRLDRWLTPEDLLVPGEGEEFVNDVDRPVSGRGNPWSVPLRVYREGDKAVTTVNLDRGFEGAPKRSHGGVVSAIYDDLCGFLLVLGADTAFTAFLTINYKAATPLEEDLRFSAWITKREGRKIFMEGECRLVGAPGDAPITTCEGLFINAPLAL